MVDAFSFQLQNQNSQPADDTWLLHSNSVVQCSPTSWILDVGLWPQSCATQIDLESHKYFLWLCHLLQLLQLVKRNLLYHSAWIKIKYFILLLPSSEGGREQTSIWVGWKCCVTSKVLHNKLRHIMKSFLLFSSKTLQPTEGFIPVSAW